MKRFDIKNEEDLPDFFITSHKILPDQRVKIQATIQKHIDSCISSTINLPKDISKDKVKQIYMDAWETGCKGVTVYREGSREGILITEEQAKATEKPQETKQEKQETKQTPNPIKARPAVLEGVTKCTKHTQHLSLIHI